MVREARRHRLEVDDLELRGVLAAFPSECVAHQSLNWAWWPVEFLPRMELENIPVPGSRVIRWGSSGRRSLGHFSRGAAISVHSSVLRWYAERDISLPAGPRVVIVDADLEVKTQAGEAGSR